DLGLGSFRLEGVEHGREFRDLRFRQLELPGQESQRPPYAEPAAGSGAGIVMMLDVAAGVGRAGITAAARVRRETMTRAHGSSFAPGRVAPGGSMARAQCHAPRATIAPDANDHAN